MLERPLDGRKNGGARGKLGHQSFCTYAHTVQTHNVAMASKIAHNTLTVRDGLVGDITRVEDSMRVENEISIGSKAYSARESVYEADPKQTEVAEQTAVVSSKLVEEEDIAEGRVSWASCEFLRPTASSMSTE